MGGAEAARRGLSVCLSLPWRLFGAGGSSALPHLAGAHTLTQIPAGLRFAFHCSSDLQGDPKQLKPLLLCHYFLVSEVKLVIQIISCVKRCKTLRQQTLPVAAIAALCSWQQPPVQV